MKKKLTKIIILLILLVAFIWSQNEWLQTTELTLTSSEIPTSFDGYRILQISDLHNHRFGQNQSRLLNAIESANADLILVTGDTIDRRRFNLSPVEELVESFPLTPTYYVSGNHEVWSGKYDQVQAILDAGGWHCLDNASVTICKDEDCLQLIGLMDPATRHQGDIETYSKKHLDALALEDDSFTILMAHRPNPFPLYSQYPVDLVFSGHAHGGQFRLPFLGGLIAPDQGLFPEYTAGMHTLNETTMVVSRGLGNSIIPLRIFNQPELVVVTLKAN